MKEMTRLELERQEAQTRENALAEAVASKKKQLLTDLVIWTSSSAHFLCNATFMSAVSPLFHTVEAV